MGSTRASHLIKEKQILACPGCHPGSTAVKNIIPVAIARIACKRPSIRCRPLTAYRKRSAYHFTIACNFSTDSVDKAVGRHSGTGNHTIGDLQSSCTVSASSTVPVPGFAMRAIFARASSRLLFTCVCTAREWMNYLPGKYTSKS